MSSKTLDTLVDDIYGVFETGKPTPEDTKVLGEDVARVVSEQFAERRPYLRLSNFGKSCRRQLWYSINTPELGEKLSGATRLKFLIGHITEAVVLWLAGLAGHSVTRKQEEVIVNGVKGHIDGLIDGELVDVKTASPPAFKKFEAGLTEETDGFGYLNQLGAYATALGARTKSFLAVEKVLGKLHLDRHDEPRTLAHYEAVADDVRQVLAKNSPPDRGYEDEKYGESGNRALGLACSYCEFRERCWPGLQVYHYARGPVFFTKIVREPKPRTSKE